jgi:hypothetical protein
MLALTASLASFIRIRATGRLTAADYRREQGRGVARDSRLTR